MQRVVFKNSNGLNLVGFFHDAETEKAIILCHGLGSDKSASGKFDKLAEILNKVGFAVLRFDFSGCGESADLPLTISAMVGDLGAAISFIEKRGFKKIGLLGHSMGGLISLKAKSPVVKSMVLWAPVTAPLKKPATKYSPEQLAEAKEKGFFRYGHARVWRSFVVISKKFLEERKKINQKKLLSHVKVPVLIIHGDSDERVRLEKSKKAVEILNKKSKLEIIHGADHNFEGKHETLFELSKQWFLGTF